MAIHHPRRVGAVLALLGVVGGLGVPVAAAQPQAVLRGEPALTAIAARWTSPLRFRWPLAGTPRVVRRFDPPPKPWLAGHRGVDLAAEPGAVVRSPAAGVVSFSGRIAGRGVVSLQHPGGLRTTYEPVEPDVDLGAQLAAGDPIGVLVAGHPGCSALACLHWGLRRGAEYLDPLSLLGLGRVRLLPARRRGANREITARWRPVRRGQARGWA